RNLESKLSVVEVVEEANDLIRPVMESALDRRPVTPPDVDAAPDVVQVLWDVNQLYVLIGTRLPIQVGRPNRDLDVFRLEYRRVPQVERIDDVQHVHSVRLPPRDDLPTDPEEEMLRRNVDVILAKKRVGLIAQRVRRVTVQSAGGGHVVGPEGAQLVTMR